MNRFINTIVIAVALAISGSVIAGIQSIDIDSAVKQMKPLQARSVDLGNYTAVIYYTTMPNGNYNVVATIGPNPGVKGSITQHRIELMPGQRYTLNVDQADNDVAILFDADAKSRLLRYGAQ